MFRNFVLFVLCFMVSLAQAVVVHTETHTYSFNTTENLVLALDKATGKEQLIEVGGGPSHMICYKGYGFVLNFYSSTVSVLDLKIHKVIQTISVAMMPSNFLIYKGFGYVQCNVTDLHVIDLSTFKVIKRLSDCGADLIIQGDYGYLRKMYNKYVSILDLRTNQEVVRISTQGIPKAIVPSNGYAYVVLEGYNQIEVLDLDSQSYVATINVGGDSGEGDFIIHKGLGYLTHSKHDIRVIDLKTLSITHSIPNSVNPESFNLYEGFGCVVNKKEKEIVVVDLQSNTVLYAVVLIHQHPLSVAIYGGCAFVLAVPSTPISVFDLKTGYILQNIETPHYGKFDFVHGHLYIGVHKIVGMHQIGGVQLFDSPYTGIEGLHWDKDPDEAFKRFEEACKLKHYDEAKRQLDIALSHGHPKAYAIAFYAFVKGVWGATQSDDWAKEFSKMDPHYYLRIGHQMNFPFELILQPEVLPFASPSVPSKLPNKKVDKKTTKSKKKAKKKAKAKAAKAKSKKKT